MGKVFNIYFKFGVVGDKYLSWCLAGLNQNIHNFATLPLHFKATAEHSVFKRGLVAPFWGLTKTYPDSKGVFILCLARMVFH